MHHRREEDETLLIHVPLREVLRRKLRLEVIAGPDQGEVAVVDEKVVHLGTQSGNALRLRDETVSGIHLEIRSTKEGIRVRDLGSTNGTYVEAVRLIEGIVPPGAVLGLGRSRVRVEALDEHVSEPLSASQSFGELQGRSECMRALFVSLERVAPTDETVLIMGETGTGKEVCARSIVAAGPRKSRPFVVVDCGAISPSLLESELFGHVRGAFTGAVQDQAGAFERAQGGTIFLDELGELPLALQTRLLRAVENREVRRVGGSREVKLDLRVIAATNRCLEEEVNQGTFRADLYYRLSVVQVRLPPLRDRPEDIELLARHFLEELGPTMAPLLTGEQLAELKRHRWPGNVRELRNYLRRLAMGEPPTPAGIAGPVAKVQVADVLPEVDLSLPFKEGKRLATEHFELRYLQALLRETGGNVSKAARLAQTDRMYLTRLLAKHGMKTE